MNTASPIKGQIHKHQLIFPVQVIVVALIYSLLLIMSFGIISLNPHEIPYLSYLIAFVVLSFALFVFITALFYNGISIINEQPKPGSIFRFKKKGLYNWNRIGEFMSLTATEGFAGLIFGVLLWVVANIILIFTYYIFCPLVTAIAALFGYVVYFIFFSPLKSIFAKTVRCVASLKNSIFLSLFFTVLYNVFLLVLVLIVYEIINTWFSNFQ